MEQQTKVFSLCWLPLGGEQKHHLNHLIPDDINGHLPWFIWGDNYDKFKSTNSFECNPEGLLKGILYGMSDTEQLAAIYSEDDYLIILEKLRLFYEFPNTEAMILLTAYEIRIKNGTLAGLQALKTGMYLLPESSKLKSDYLLSLWEKACENKNDMSIYEEILKLIPKIDLTDINKPSKEIACYYGFCSLYLLKHDTKLKHDINKYIELYIDEIITINEIQLKIDDLLNNPDKEFTPEELRVHDN